MKQGTEQPFPSGEKADLEGAQMAAGSADAFWMTYTL
jgi:hypothetical protein